MNDEVCLVVTRLKSCRDMDTKLAFVSNSVPDYLEKESLKTIDHIVLDGPWDTHEYQVQATQFSFDRLVRYRKELSKTLNRVLGLDYKERAWGFLLDSWLLMFVEVIYDRVNKLENAREKLGNVYLYGSVEQISSFATTLDFVMHWTDDRFNQQLYSEIAKVLGIKVKPCKKNSLEDEPPADYTPKYNWKGRIYNALTPILRSMFRIWVRYTRPLVVLNSFFPRKESFCISVRSLGRVLLLPWKFLLKEVPRRLPMHSWRKHLKVVEQDKYDIVANSLFKTCFPISLLEGLKDYSDQVSTLESIPVLGSAVNFYYIDAYKILASRVLEKGGNILGFQHGGVTNHTYPHLNEKVGETHVDDFYTWRKRSRLGSYLPTTKLRKINSYKRRRESRVDFTDVLFVSSNPGIYKFRHFVNDVDKYSKMIANQHEFYIGLNENVKEYFLLRPYLADRGSRYKERWLDVAGEQLRFDPNKNFYESMVSSKIYVSDHISTTWLEAFYIGMPVLLFLDIELYMMCDEIRGLFEDLRSVGVLHSTPESASAFLNERYNSIEAWWKLPKTQLAVDKFKKHFFVDQDDFVKPWTDELLSVRREALHSRLNSA